MRIINSSNDGKIVLEVSPEELDAFQKINGTQTPPKLAKDVLWEIRWERDNNPKPLNLALGYFLRSNLDEVSYEEFLAELGKPLSPLLSSVRGLGKANLRVLREYFLNNA